MDQTFNKLLGRSNPQINNQIGNPWEVIPIKNRKQARDTTEIHLSNRGVQILEDFDKFPNLEVLWLNNNKLEKIEGLETNFRIKHLYVQNNKIKALDTDTKYFKNLETLLLYNNELRDLDYNLQILADFTNLKQLDLFENPLAEEPNYRLRVIYALPWLKILDRHQITYEERQKAKQLMERDLQFAKKKKELEIKIRIPPSGQFSKGERDLYREAAKIKKQHKEQQEKEKQAEQLEKTSKILVFDPNKLPITKEEQELQKRKKEQPFSLLSEWDKNKLIPLFKQYDKDKKAQIPIEKLNDIYDQLIVDKYCIGKVPSCSNEEFIVLIQGDNYKNNKKPEEKNENQFLQWDDFKFNLNKVYWTKPDLENTKQKIKELYYLSKKKNNPEDLYKAIKIENALFEEGDTQKVLEQKQNKINDQGKSRIDIFDFGTFTFKKNFPTSEKYVL